MAYPLPQFNLLCDAYSREVPFIWPLTSDPYLAAVPCQLRGPKGNGEPQRSVDKRGHDPDGQLYWYQMSSGGESLLWPVGYDILGNTDYPTDTDANEWGFLYFGSVVRIYDAEETFSWWRILGTRVQVGAGFLNHYQAAEVYQLTEPIFP